MESFFAKVKIFRFWPKTMDYNKAFWPKSRSFFVVLLLHSGRCYEAEICAILLPLRCPFRWNPFLPKSKFSDFGLKPWTIIRRFCRNRGHSLWSFYSTVEGAMKLKFAPFCSSWMPFPMESFFAKVKIFRFWPKTMDYNKAFWPKSRSFFVVLLLHSGRCYEAEICAILLPLRYIYIYTGTMDHLKGNRIIQC